MLLSAPDWCFFKGNLTPDVYYRRLHSMGIAGVEMLAPERWPAARAAGLSILNIPGPGMEQGLNNLANHAVLAPEITPLIEQACEAGIPQVIVFSGNRQGRSDAEGIANCVTALQALAPHAEAAGVTLVLEVLNSIEHVDYHADHTAFGVAVVEAVASPAVKLLYDVYHMQRMNEDVLADLLAYHPLIGHIHLAQTPGRTAPLPGGPIDHAVLIPQVLAAGYHGYWGLEHLPRDNDLQELATVCQFLQQCTTDIAK